MAPAAPRSSAVTGLPPSNEAPTVMRPSRARRSCTSRDDREDRHHLGRGGDVEPRLPRIAVRATTQPDRGLAQRAVVHVQRTAPADPQLIELVRIAMQDRRIEHRRQQIVRRPDRMDVTREVQVQILHRHHLRHAAARGAALHPEHRPQRRLAQTRDRPLADHPETLRQPHQRRRLALARLRRRHPRHAHQLAVRLVRHAVEHRQIDLRLVTPVGLVLRLLEPALLRDRVDRLKLGLLRDLKAALHRCHPRSVLCAAAAGTWEAGEFGGSCAPAVRGASVA